MNSDFDLDNTLLLATVITMEVYCGTGSDQHRHYAAENDRFYRDYQKSQLDVHEYLRFALQPLTRFSLEGSSASTIYARRSDPIRLTQAEALLAKHRARGDYLLIITATSSFITRPVPVSGCG